MSSGRGLATAVFGLFLLTASASALALEQVGRLRFILPDGWQRLDHVNVATFQAPGIDAEEVTLQVYPTQRLHRTPAGWFRSAIREIEPTAKGVVQQLPPRFSGEKRIEIRILGVVTQDEYRRPVIHVFAGVSDRHHAQLLHYQTRNARLLREHHQALDMLSSQLEFVNLRPTQDDRRLLAGTGLPR